jgi:hypothetical protein
VAGERLEVAVVDRRVGVLLRIEHPHEQVGVAHEPVDLEVVRHLGGVVVGQVEQHQPLQVGVLGRRVEHAHPRHLVPLRDADPRQDLARTLRPPRTGEGPGGRGPLDADAGELEVGELVEQRRLARAGRAGERHDRVLAGQAQPLLGALGDLSCRLEPRLVETAGGGDHEVLERLDPVGDTATALAPEELARSVDQLAHETSSWARRASSTARAASRSRFAAVADAPEVSSTVR